MNKKKVSLSEMYPLMEELLEQNGKVSFTVVGQSMQPMLYNKRDSVTVYRPEFPIKKYDLPFYRLDDGKFILHRVIKVNGDGTYDCRGDNCWVSEKSIRQDQIIGVVKSFKRKNKVYSTDESVGYFIYVRMWPLLHHFKKYYKYYDSVRKWGLFLKKRLFPAKDKISFGDGTVKEISFKPAAAADIKNILLLAQKHADLEAEKYNNYVLNRNWIKSESAEKKIKIFAEKHFLWVAYDGKKAVAYIAGSVSEKETDNFPLGKLSYIYVDDEYRSSGIGSKLIGLFKDYCKEHNCTNLSVSFLYLNNDARRFYEKNGFSAYTETFLCCID